MCTVDVKIALFRVYCTSFYTSHIWYSYSKAKMKKLQVAFNDALRNTFTFTHLADAFIQKRLTIAFRLHIYCQYVCSLGIKPTTVCAASAMLYHWATGTREWILLKYPRWMSASQLFVSCDVPTLHAVLRNYMYSFMCRLSDSRNTIIIALNYPRLSDTRCSSLFWKHRNSSLYVFSQVIVVCEYMLVCNFLILCILFYLWCGPNGLK